MKYTYQLVLALSLLSLQSFAQKNTAVIKNIAYAEADNKKLMLDIYMPSAAKDPYLIVWVHGGAWHSGSKESPPVGMLQEGYALASVNYRLSTEAIFPACIHDIKAAIRFLRGNAKKYGYRSDKIIIWGSSAGGHLAALVGTTNNNKYYEGNLGTYPNESSSVQAVMDFYGPTDMLTILNQSTPLGISVRAPALALLFGKPVDQAADLVRKASPVYQVDSTATPILIVHGDQDPQVPVNQSLELMAAYKKEALPVQLEIIPGAGHGGDAFEKKEIIDKMKEFLNKTLSGK